MFFLCNYLLPCFEVFVYYSIMGRGNSSPFQDRSMQGSRSDRLHGLVHQLITLIRRQLSRSTSRGRSPGCCTAAARMVIVGHVYALPSGARVFLVLERTIESRLDWRHVESANGRTRYGVAEIEFFFNLTTKSEDILRHIWS